MNRHDEALKAYEEASKYARGFGQYFNWGYIYETRNEYDRAIQVFDMASQFMPEGGRMALYQDDKYAKSVCAIHLGTLLCRQHRSEQGLLAFYRAVAINPEIQEAWMRMGLEHAVREGEKTKALYCLDRAARIDPKSRGQIHQYLTSQGNVKEAARYSPKSPMPQQYPAPHDWDPEVIGRDSMQRYISDTLVDTPLAVDQKSRNKRYWAEVAPQKKRGSSHGVDEDHAWSKESGEDAGTPSSPSLKRGGRRGKNAKKGASNKASRKGKGKGKGKGKEKEKEKEKVIGKKTAAAKNRKKRLQEQKKDGKAPSVSSRPPPPPGRPPPPRGPPPSRRAVNNGDGTGSGSIVDDHKKQPPTKKQPTKSDTYDSDW